MRGASGSVPLRATLQKHDLTEWHALDNRGVDRSHYIASHSDAASCSRFNPPSSQRSEFSTPGTQAQLLETIILHDVPGCLGERDDSNRVVVTRAIANGEASSSNSRPRSPQARPVASPNQRAPIRSVNACRALRKPLQ